MRTSCKNRGLAPLAAGIMLLLICLASTPDVSAADVVIIAHPKVSDNSLSESQLKAIFLGQEKSWPAGGRVELVMLRKYSEIHDEFFKKTIGRNISQFTNYWKKQVFTGKGKMPRQFDSESEVVEYVSATEGAIGYISSGTDKGAAKIITITQ